MGGASSVAWAMFLIVAVFTLVQFRLLREKD
jgi:ABC-type sugar transport system permease subunit